MRTITDKAKQRAEKSLLSVIKLLSIALIVCSVIFFLVGFLGFGGIHAWEFSLYDDEYNIIFIKGLRFTDRFEPILFIVRGMFYLGMHFFLQKFAVPHIEKRKLERQRQDSTP